MSSRANLPFLFDAISPMKPLQLTIGTVTAQSDSDEGQAAKPGKVRVVLDMLQAKDSEVVVEATLLSPFVGVSYGAYFVPPDGAKALIGFLNGREDAYVLGFFWNGQQPAPGPLEKTGFIIMTESKQSITFDDAKRSITIEDGGGEEGSSISIDTENKRIVIESKGELSISAARTLTLKGESVVIEDTTQASKLELTDTKAELTSNTISVEASAETVLKGNPINLN